MHCPSLRLPKLPILKIFLVVTKLEAVFSNWTNHRHALVQGGVYKPRGQMRGRGLLKWPQHLIAQNSVNVVCTRPLRLIQFRHRLNVISVIFPPIIWMHSKTISYRKISLSWLCFDISISTRTTCL